MTIDLSLLPQPKELTYGEGVFRISAQQRIGVPSLAPKAVAAARLLQASLRSEFGLELGLRAVKAESEADVCRLVIVDLGGEQSVGRWAEPTGLAAGGYSITIQPRGVEVSANDEAGLFYGVQTLIQITRSCGRVLPGLTIRDWPSVPTRGYLLDVTRGKVPTRETLERFAKTIAQLKANHLQLYMEHAFDFPSHPAIGRGVSPLTPDDVLWLDALCREHHIELAANFQAMGHQGHLLKLPEYDHLAETPWRFTFATDNDEVFDFVGELFDDLLPCFSSKLVNVNADEPWDLGRGVSKGMTERIGVPGVYLHHLKRLHELVAGRDRRMAMWADVLKGHADLIDQLPEDILLIDWQYEALDRYATLDALRASGREFWVCAATSSWIALFPRLENAIRNIRDYFQQGIEAGATGVIVSDWGDSGHDQPLTNSLYPFAWAAECAWNGGATSTEAFDRAFSVQVLGDWSGEVTPALRRLGAAMQTEAVWLPSWNSAMALYEDPLAGKIIDVASPDVVAETRAAAEALVPLIGRIQDHIVRADLGFVCHQIIFACDKVETTRAVRGLLHELAMHGSADGNHRSLGALTQRMAAHRSERGAIKTEFQRRWMASSRRSSIAFNLGRFDALLARYDAAIEWLSTQEELIARGGAVDARLASYDRGGYAVLHEATYGMVKDLETIIGHDALPDDLKVYLADIEEAQEAVHR